MAIGIAFALLGTRHTSPAPPSRPSSPPPVVAGVNFNCLQAPSGDRAETFADLAEARVPWVRLIVFWDRLEPSKGHRSRGYLTSLDRCVAAARAAQMRVLVVFLATPPWARSGGGDTTPPRHPDAYAAALSFLAGRYGTKVSAWEVWNEENSRAFWSSGSARAYVQLLQASYRAVKHAAPRALVVFGGTLGNAPGWLRSCYRAGAKGYFDVMATHPYPSEGGISAAAALGSVKRVRRVMLAHRDDKPIWFTEVGWSAPFAVSAREQAAALTNALDFTSAHLPFVAHVFWFEAKNEVPSVTPRSWQGGLSLIAPNLTPRPAFDALARWIRSHARAR